METAQGVRHSLETNILKPFKPIYLRDVKIITTKNINGIHFESDTNSIHKMAEGPSQ